MAAQIVSIRFVSALERDVRVVRLPEDLADKLLDQAIVDAQERQALWKLYFEEADQAGCSDGEGKAYADLMTSV
jgi:hypothetical protein